MEEWDIFTNAYNQLSDLMIEKEIDIQLLKDLLISYDTLPTKLRNTLVSSE